MLAKETRLRKVYAGVSVDLDLRQLSTEAEKRNAALAVKVSGTAHINFSLNYIQ